MTVIFNANGQGNGLEFCMYVKVNVFFISMSLNSHIIHHYAPNVIT